MINPFALTHKLSIMSSFKRRLILIIIDIFLITTSVFTSYYLKYGTTFILEYKGILPLTLLFIFLGVPLYIFTGQYKALTRYVGSKTIYQLAFRNVILLILIYILSYFLEYDFGDLTNLVLIWLILTIFISTNRFILRDLLLKSLNKERTNKHNIIIYGAGKSGAQLASSLRINNQYKILGFIDESSQLFGRNIYGIPIYPPNKLLEFAPIIDQILLSEQITSFQTKEILKELIKKYSTNILEIFSIEELAYNKTKSKSLRKIRIEDLLGREGIYPREELLSEGVKNKVICVTGAGGSIGSEICRILLGLSPKKIILFEINEACLYSLEQELNKKNNFNISIQAVLGSTTDERLVDDVFSKFNIDIVFHTAAYKHVPLVENNPLQGLFNNCISTKITCKASKEYGVKKYILISSDKAVRPTNIMGASKRASELIVQGFASEIKEKSDMKSKTIFSMVRFGNVIGSSGSVIPLFKKQIAEGGPITITHKDIVRYFMTIKEASELVIQSNSLAKGGDLFLLDMGTPVKIYDLAKNMIQISGLSIKDDKNPNGDIEIINTGLRPGEKLYEELLINAEAEKTTHKLIYTAKEESISCAVLWPLITDLENAICKGDEGAVFKILKIIVPEWQHSV